MAQDIIKKTGVREHLATSPYVGNISEDVYAAIDEAVKQRLEEAAERADANNRNTVHARDI